MTVEDLITELGRYRLSSRVFLSLNHSAGKVQLAVETHTGSLDRVSQYDGEMARGVGSRTEKIDIPDE